MPTFALPTFRNAVYAHGASLEECVAAVESALESYVLWAVKTGQPLPEIDGVLPPSLEPTHDSLVMDNQYERQLDLSEWQLCGGC